MFPNDSRSMSRATDIHQAELFKYKDIQYLRKNMFGFLWAAVTTKNTTHVE